MIRRRWEYKALVLGLQTAGAHPPTVCEDDVDALNATGAEGWEFLSWAIRDDARTVAMLRREMDDE